MMLSIVNYMDEIKNIEKAIDDLLYSGESKIIRKNLCTMLHELEKTADEMAAYINGYWNNEDIDFFKQSNAYNLMHKNYQGYLDGLDNVQRLERIELICAAQTRADKMYFLEEYAKYKEEHEEIKVKRAR